MIELNLPCSQMLATYKELIARLEISININIVPGKMQLLDGEFELSSKDAILFYLLRKADQLPNDEIKFARISEFAHLISGTMEMLMDINLQRNKTANFVEQMMGVVYENLATIDGFLASITCIQGVNSPLDFFLACELKCLLGCCGGDFASIMRYVKTNGNPLKPARFELTYNCDCYLEILALVFSSLELTFMAKKGDYLELVDAGFRISGLYPALFYLMRVKDQLPQAYYAFGLIDYTVSMACAACCAAHTLKSHLATNSSQELGLALMGNMKGIVTSFVSFIEEYYFINGYKSVADVFCAAAFRWIIARFYNQYEAEANIPGIIRYCKCVLGPDAVIYI